ncbi:hypothetical protein D3C74_213960 [compost metagenome]
MKRKSILLLIVIFILLFSSYLFNRHNKYEIVQTLAEVTVGEVTRDVSIEQTFIADKNNLSAIEILFGTYNRINNSNLVIQLIDDKGDLLVNKEIQTSSLKDNQFKEFPFPRIGKSKGREYSILIGSENGFENNAITVWASLSDSYSGGELLVNGEIVEGDIAFKTTYSSSEFDTLKEMADKVPINKDTLIFILVGVIICSIMLMYKSMDSISNMKGNKY